MSEFFLLKSTTFSTHLSVASFQNDELETCLERQAHQRHFRSWCLVNKCLRLPTFIVY